MGAHKSNVVPLYNKKNRGKGDTLHCSNPQIIFRGASLRLHARPPVFGRGHTSLLLHAPHFFGGGEAHFMASAPARHEPYSHATDVRYPQALHSTSAFPAANKPAFFSAALFRRPLAVQHTEYIYVSSRISGHSNGSEGRIAADAAHMSCIGLRLQGGPKNWGHRLMTTILSNLNRFKKFYFHWKIPS